jgi:hypothetical protein
MGEKLTSFDTFRRLKEAQEAEQRERRAAVRGEATRAGYDEIVSLVEDTARVVDRLENGLKRAIGREIAYGTQIDADEVRALARRYERLSWYLHGQLRAILDGSRKR